MQKHKKRNFSKIAHEIRLKSKISTVLYVPSPYPAPGKMVFPQHWRPTSDGVLMELCWDWGSNLSKLYGNSKLQSGISTYFKTTMIHLNTDHWPVVGFYIHQADWPGGGGVVRKPDKNMYPASRPVARKPDPKCHFFPIMRRGSSRYHDPPHPQVHACSEAYKKRWKLQDLM